MRVCWPQHKHKVIAAVMVGLFCIGLYSINQSIEALATGTTSPNDTVTAEWAAQGDCAGQSLHECINDNPGSPNTNSYMRTSGSDQQSAQFGMQHQDINRGAEQITVWLYMRNNFDGEENDLEVELRGMSGGTTSTQVIVYGSSEWAWQSVSWSGAYSQNDINNMEVHLEQIEDVDCTLFIFNCSSSGVDTIDVATLYVEVEYDPYPDLTQSGYRFYENDDSLTPGAARSDTNEQIDDPGSGSEFRLRMLTTVSTNNFIDNEFDYRLQVGEKIDTCSNASYSDVEAGSGPIRFNANPSISDGDAVNSHSDDPQSPNTIVHQTYNEANPVLANNGAVVDEDLLWDFSLINENTEPGIEYCLRMVYEDGNELASYDQYPVIVTTGELFFNIVDQLGDTVSDPGFIMAPTVVLSECQSTAGTLGIEEQRLRITNDLVTEGWGVSIAATDGPSALWSAGTLQYDFNDPAGSPAGCAAGTDGDVYAGQMSIDPSTSTIEPSAGCSTTGVSAAPASAFEEGTNDIIDLVNASSTSERFCDFFVEGIHIEQTIPPEQPMGDYSIDMTITIVAF